MEYGFVLIISEWGTNEILIHTDGLAFFLSGGTAVNELDQENRQKEMRHVLKKKVKRSIKSALPHGAKPNRGFRKFVRHL